MNTITDALHTLADDTASGDVSLRQTVNILADTLCHAATFERQMGCFTRATELLTAASIVRACANVPADRVDRPMEYGRRVSDT